LVGPVPLYEGAVVPESKNMENAWQFAKVYPEHVGDLGFPDSPYFEWARRGWKDPRGHRHPMGRRAPAYSWWGGERLGYVEARKRIYIPLYARAVAKTEAFSQLRALYVERGELTLWDFDGYDYRAMGMSWKEVRDNVNRPMGHAFVLAYLLEGLR